MQCERPTALRWLTAWGFRLNLLYAVCMYVFYLCLICAAWSALNFLSVACMHTWTNVYRQYRAPTAKGQLRMPCTACSQFVCLRWDSTRLSSPILQMTALRFVCARTHACLFAVMTCVVLLYFLFAEHAYQGGLWDACVMVHDGLACVS